MSESLGITPLDELVAAFRGYMAIDDPAHIAFALAVAVAARLDGDPLWGMLVGAPSSGKIETLRALDEVADEHLDDISAAGLLSWLPGKRPRPTGLLSRRQGRVFATVADFSTLLAMSDKGSRDTLYALLRRAYDGRVVRELGNAPEPLRWEGRLTLLAAVTPTVDNYATHADALGARWLYVRLPTPSEATSRQASRKARQGGTTLREHREHVRGLAGPIVQTAVARAVSIRESDMLGDQLDDAAMVTCVGRADVPRSGYGRRDIIGAVTIEEPPRLAGQLALLARASLALGLTEEQTASLCRRAALDSMPLARRDTLAALASGEPLAQSEVARRTGLDRGVARRALEELAATGIASCEGAEDEEEGPRGDWYLTGEHAPLIAKVFTARNGVPKSVLHPHNPPREGGSNTLFGTAPAADISGKVEAPA